MSQAAERQPDDPAYCAHKTTRAGIEYRCIREVHKGNSHTLKPLADIADPLRAYFAKTTVADLEDRSDLIPADTPTAVMQTMAELSELVGLAEIDRRFDLLSYEVKTGIAIAAELRVAKLCWADDRPADVASVQRIKKHVDAWLLQVGIRDDEDGGA